MNPADRTKGFALVMLAAVLWGTTGTSQGLAPAEVSSSVIGALRILLGGIVLFLYAFYKGGFSKTEKWPFLITSFGILSVAAYQLTFFYGVRYAGVAIGTMVGIGSGPISAGILAFLFYNEKLSKKWMISTLIGIIGLVLTTYGSRGSGLNYNVFGIILSIGAGFFYASYTMVSKKLLETNDVNAVMAVLFLGGALLLTPFLFIYDVAPLLNPGGIIIIIHLGVIATGVSYFFFARGLKLIKVSETATLSLAEPLTATLLGILVLHESPSFLSFLGVFFIFAGLCVLSIQRRQRTEDR
ncbi:DMT family transporter [Flexistipes sp.]|uniref:DMT family transporter n=1 Tax=Flexistipes sp. TaxID=3088135 RepID=UPI002E1C2932|nr:EamA family transporter [Flexistipes sp.]